MSEKLEWMSWGEAAFNRAKEENKLILIFLYSNWNHLSIETDRQVYSRPEIAELVDKYFVPVRVNCDLRPDVFEAFNRQYLNAVMTPAGGLVSNVPVQGEVEKFKSWFEHVTEDYRSGKLAAPPLSSRAWWHLPVKQPGKLNKDILGKAYGLFRKALDEDRKKIGAEGQASGMPGYDELEMAYLKKSVDENDEQKIFLNVESTGLKTYFDAVWGGMFRLGGDMEGPGARRAKLLDENARAIGVLSSAYLVYDDEYFLEMIKSNLDYINSFLSLRNGGYSGSQYSDLAGPAGYMEGAAFYSLDDAGRKKIGMPAIDKNVYADSNALLVKNLIQAADALSDSGLRNNAVNTMDYLFEKLWNDEKGVAHYIDGKGRTGAYGILRDNVYLLDAMIEVYESTGRTDYLNRAVKIAKLINSRFTNLSGGGYRAVVTDERLIKSLVGDHQPVETNMIMADCLRRLNIIAGIQTFITRAEKTLEDFAGDYSAASSVIPPVYAATVHRFTNKALVLTIVGDKNNSVTAELRREARRFYEPNKVVMTLDPVEDANELGQLPYKAKPEPTLYACVETACSLPMGDPARVNEHLRNFVGTYMHNREDGFRLQKLGPIE